MEDKVLRLTIGFIKSCYDKSDVERLVTASTNTLKSQLSYISKLNVRSSMIISKIAEIEKDIYIDGIRKKTNELSNYAINDDLMDELGTFIDYLVATLQSDIVSLEGAGKVGEDEFSVYNITDDNPESQYKVYQNTDPTFMQYFAEKDTMKELLDICASFTSMKNTVNNSLKSKENSICIHFNLILKNITKLLRYHLDIYQKEKDISSAANLALLCYNHYGWWGQSDASDFLNRTPSEIQTDLEALL